ncbi:MAG: DUF5049 domain-containing protein [Butyrivibrio sp.]|nr:DUF5049 domain-containing protein [Butyrivibrio sp.]MBR1642152.1 DUF5049 domain-containing protein [Butyrivibrio sp.]
MTDIILSQILSIRDSGVINMLDVNGVQRIAFDQGLYDLVLYIEEDKKRYFHFIMYGKEPEVSQ